MILRCKHCLDLLVSLLSLVLPNAHSPLRTNFSFVFRQETKLPNVFAIWLARAKITKKKWLSPQAWFLIWTGWAPKYQAYSVSTLFSAAKNTPKVFVWEKKNPFIWKQKAPQHSTITVGTQAERRATLWILLDYVRKGWAGGNLLVINDGPENGI